MGTLLGLTDLEGFGYEGISEIGRADDPVLYDGGAVLYDGKMVFTIVGKIDRM